MSELVDIKSNKIKFSLIGCGRIAQRHAEILGNYLIDKAQLVSVCDIINEKAEALARQYNIPWFTDIDTMLNSVCAM